MMLHTTTSRQIARLARSKPGQSWNNRATPSATSLPSSLPLWSMEELLAGYVLALPPSSLVLTALHHRHSLPLQPGYDRLRTALEKVLPFLAEDTSFFNRTAHSLPKMTDAVIEVLKRERRRRTERDSREEEAGSNIKDDKALLSTASKDEVDDALEVLVRNATEEFGFAPPGRLRAPSDSNRARRCASRVRVL